MSTIPNEPGYLTSMGVGNRYNISVQTLATWTKYANFPADCRKRHGQFMLYRVDALDNWLRNRPVSTKGPRPRWLSVVWHSAA